MKIFCIDRNYRQHAAELEGKNSYDPLFFMKPETAIIRNNLPFFYPAFSNEIYYEAGLVLRICKLGKNIQPRFASSYYNEIGLGIGFTAHDLLQKCISQGLPWETAKSFDGSGPVSGFVPLASLPDSQSINFSLKKNGSIAQEGNSRLMIFSFNQIVSHISSFCTLKIGDLIFTGTPAGTGPVVIGDKLEAFLEDKRMLQIDIK